MQECFELVSLTINFVGLPSSDGRRKGRPPFGLLRRVSFNIKIVLGVRLKTVKMINISIEHSNTLIIEQSLHKKVFIYYYYWVGSSADVPGEKKEFTSIS